MTEAVENVLAENDTYFLVSHFHYVLIAGTVFACFAGLIFWYPKMFGHKLNERIGKWFFWLFMTGFNICFFPMYFLGLQGMPRRIYKYGEAFLAIQGNTSGRNRC